MFEMYSHKCMQESNVYLNKLHFSVVDVPFFLGEKKQDDVIICKLVQEQWNFNRKNIVILSFEEYSGRYFEITLGIVYCYYLCGT